MNVQGDENEGGCVVWYTRTRPRLGRICKQHITFHFLFASQFNTTQVLVISTPLLPGECSKPARAQSPQTPSRVYSSHLTDVPNHR